MQEENSQQTVETKNKTPRNITIWGILGCGLIAAALIGIVWFYFWMPMNVNRDLGNELPWQQGDLVIEKVDAQWKYAQGNTRLAQRTHLYPEVRIQLGQAKGKGRIDAIFLNPDGTQVGDTHFLRYEDGQFEEKNDKISRSEGNSITIWLETGYTSEDLFALHRINEDENLWRIVLIHRSESNPQGVRLGQRSIPAEATLTTSENEQK